jgi:hypothetical protein
VGAGLMRACTRVKGLYVVHVLKVTTWDEEEHKGPAGMSCKLSQVDETLLFLRGGESWEQRQASRL